MIEHRWKLVCLFMLVVIKVLRDVGMNPNAMQYSKNDAIQLITCYEELEKEFKI